MFLREFTGRLWAYDVEVGAEGGGVPPGSWESHATPRRTIHYHLHKFSQKIYTEKNINNADASKGAEGKRKGGMS